MDGFEQQRLADEEHRRELADEATRQALLPIPADHEAQQKHCRRQQLYYDDRFPTQAEFAEFLRANLDFVFDESSFYECSMAYCAGGPVSEGYSSDVDQHPPAWFRQYETSTAQGTWTGARLLELLRTLPPDESRG